MRCDGVKVAFIFAGYPGDGGVSAVADEGTGSDIGSDGDKMMTMMMKRKKADDWTHSSTGSAPPQPRAAKLQQLQPKHMVHTLTHTLYILTDHPPPPTHMLKPNAQLSGRDRVAAAVAVRLRLRLQGQVVQQIHRDVARSSGTCASASGVKGPIPPNPTSTRYGGDGSDAAKACAACSTCSCRVSCSAGQATAAI
jgi:hypothetical protein